MSRRTAVIATALLLLIGARMPAWRVAAVANPPAATAPSGQDSAHDWSVARTTWHLAPGLSHRLGLVLVLEGS